MSHFKKNNTQTSPTADKHLHTQNHHGIESSDYYHWLRAENWQEAMREPEKLPDDIHILVNNSAC